jgi:ligand-binding sensor domain-containing protein
MRRSFILVGAWTCLGLPLAGGAQPVGHLDISDGLINNKVYSIAQDDRGFIWIGTENGLQRYDGSAFVNYREELLDPDNSRATVYSIYPDKRQLRLLVNYRSGVLDPETNRFHYDQARAGIDPMRDSLLLLAIPRLGKAIGGAAIFKTVKDSRRNLWINTRTGTLYRYNFDTRKITTYSLAAITGRKPILADRDLTMIVSCIFEDDHHHLWVGTENAGLLEYDPLRDNFSVTPSPGETGSGVQYNYIIICIFQDRDENLWIGTDKGISIFNPYRQYFTTIRNDPRESRTLPKREINGCLPTGKGNILVGTWGGGITEYDSLLHWIRNIDFTEGPGEKNLVWGFVQDKDQRIWVACQHGFLHRMDADASSILTFQPAEMQRSTIRCMAMDQEGNIWFGLHNGRIAEWDAAKKKFFAMATPSLLPSVTDIFIDTEHRFWVSTEKGFKEFDPVTRQFIATYLKNDVDPQTLSANGCHGIAQLNDSLLLIATDGGGLDFFNKRTGRCTRLTTKEGFPANIVHAIRKDGSGRVWFTTDYGLYSCQPTWPQQPGELSFTSYRMGKSTINAPFVADRFCTTHDGRWMTYTSAELILFCPDSLCRQPEGETRVTLTGFKMFEKTWSIDALTAPGKPILLSHSENFPEIGFRVLNFSTLQPIVYYYRLSGIDKDWVGENVRQSARYTNLPPGDYTFLVRAAIGNKTGPTTSFVFRIIPSFWSTAWFRGTCLLLIALLIILFIRWRMRVFRTAETRKAQMKKEMAEMEMKVLRTQMNPHFLFNSLNSINGYILEHDMDRASDYLALFSRLMRMILDHSQQLFIPIDQELTMLNLYLQLEAMRFDHKFDYSITVDKNIDPLETHIPSMLMQPYVENAIWHGLMHKPARGTLNIVIQRMQEVIEITIEDNGIGRQRSGELKKHRPSIHRSKGMALTEQRLALLAREKNARVAVQVFDLHDTRGKGSGTRVRITIDIHATFLNNSS